MTQIDPMNLSYMNKETGEIFPPDVNGDSILEDGYSQDDLDNLFIIVEVKKEKGKWVKKYE